jgi:hypothetical protein
MALGMPYGLQAMLKEGHKHISGLEEAVVKNIEACKELAQITRTSLGPNGAFETCLEKQQASYNAFIFKFKYQQNYLDT